MALYPTFDGYPSLAPLSNPTSDIPFSIPPLNPSIPLAPAPSFTPNTIPASQFDTSTHAALLPLTVLSLPNEATPSAPPADNELQMPFFRDIQEFIPQHNHNLSPGNVPQEILAEAPILSEGLLQAVDHLEPQAFGNYHPWMPTEGHPVHVLIKQMAEEIYPKLLENATSTLPIERLKICEKAIFETSNLPTLSYHDKGMIELGLRHALAQHLIKIEATQLGTEFTYPGNGAELCANLQQLERNILLFSTRFYFFHSGITNAFDSLIANVSEKVQSGIVQRIQGEFSSGSSFNSLPFNEQVTRCNEVIQSELETLLPTAARGHVLTPASKAWVIFHPATYRSAAQLLVTENTPLFKTAFEQGRPLPANLEMILNGLYTLASNNNTYFLLEDPRRTFIEAVFGTADITALQEQVNTEAEQERTALEASVPKEPVFAFVKRLFKQAPSAAQVTLANQQINEKQTAKTNIVRELQYYMYPDTRQEGLDLDLSSVSTPSTTPEVIDTGSSTAETTPPPSTLISTPTPTEILSPPPSLPITPAITPTPTPPPAPLPRTPVITPAPVTTIASSSASSSAPTRTPTPRSSSSTPTPSTKPMASYAHIAFKDLLERDLSGDSLYKELSNVQKRDVIRHLFYISLKGPVETSIEAAFMKRVNRTTIPYVNTLYDRELNQLGNKIPKSAHSENAKLGEAILNDYYAGKQNSVEFTQKLDRFATDARFLSFVQDQAIAASVKTSGKDWALNNLKKPTYVHLTMQALERYLHTA